MSVFAAGWMSLLLGLYAAAGFVFALPFLAWGLPQIDPAARGTGIAFRLMILPGTAAFWPLLLRRWLRSRA